MRYALIKFRVYLLGEQTFAVYTDHASLRTAMKSPHLSQRMARWLSFFAEYNFVVHYKPGKNNILADALSRRPDYDPSVVLGRQVIDDEDDSEEHCAVCAASGINLTSVSPEMNLRGEIAAAYAVYANILAYLRSPSDETLVALSRNTRNQIDRYHLDGDLLYYKIDRFDAPRVVVTNDDVLRAHGASHPVSDTVTAAETAAHFVDCVFRHHGLPESIVSDRDPKFTTAFWAALFQLLGTKLSMSTAAHPETDGQTERVNRVLEDVLRSYATSFTSWSKFLPLAEFALNNAEHASTGVTPFFANNARHPRVPALLAVAHPMVPGASTLGGDDDDDHVEDNGVDDIVTSGDHDPKALHAINRSKSKQVIAAPSSAASPLAAWTARTLIDPGNTGTPIAANYTLKPPVRQVDNAAVSAFVQRRESIARFVRDALQEAVDKQKENADKRGRKNMATFTIGEQVLLSTDSIRSSAVTNLGASKLAPRIIGPIRVMKVNGEAYTLDIPTSLRLHPTFYVGRLKKYYPATVPSAMDPPAPTPERRANAPPDAPPASPTAAAVPPSAVPRRDAVPTPESAAATPDWTGAPLQGPFSPVRPEPSPPQPPPERLEHDSSQLRHSPGSSWCGRYPREAPPPIVDSAGQTCWIVDRLVAHEDPPRATSLRWLGYPPDEDTWEPRSVLLRDVPDVVLEYENGIANESAAAAVPAATKTAIENPTVADPAATENANGHVATGMDPVVNKHGGLRRE
ncbi:unnamed protein product [Phytophthora fragariaefolia]|uniref:Unnamed protein product n=1 Tax=Phytophthora fragariaefolia TaxID=1490495 RepID=A0A9W6XYW8_9STRA|nr:unnamed protein product [Phytophthora fragariaefolia]